MREGDKKATVEMEGDCLDKFTKICRQMRTNKNREISRMIREFVAQHDSELEKEK